MKGTVRNFPTQSSVGDSASLTALYDEALEISEQRDKTEREIKRLAESGFKDEAWKLLVKHLQIKEPRQR